MKMSEYKNTAFSIGLELHNSGGHVSVRFTTTNRYPYMSEIYINLVNGTKFVKAVLCV